MPQFFRLDWPSSSDLDHKILSLANALSAVVREIWDWGWPNKDLWCWDLRCRSSQWQECRWQLSDKLTRTVQAHCGRTVAVMSGRSDSNNNKKFTVKKFTFQLKLLLTLLSSCILLDSKSILLSVAKIFAYSCAEAIVSSSYNPSFRIPLMTEGFGKSRRTLYKLSAALSSSSCRLHRSYDLSSLNSFKMKFCLHLTVNRSGSWRTCAERNNFKWFIFYSSSNFIFKFDQLFCT